MLLTSLLHQLAPEAYQADAPKPKARRPRKGTDREKVLSFAEQHGKASIADVAALLGSTRQAASAVLSDLLDEALLTRAEVGVYVPAQGITPDDAAVLEALADGPLTQSELQPQLSIPESSLRKILRRLKDQGEVKLYQGEQNVWALPTHPTYAELLEEVTQLRARLKEEA